MIMHTLAKKCTYISTNYLIYSYEGLQYSVLVIVADSNRKLTCTHAPWTKQNTHSVGTMPTNNHWRLVAGKAFNLVVTVRLTRILCFLSMGSWYITKHAPRKSKDCYYLPPTHPSQFVKIYYHYMHSSKVHYACMYAKWNLYARKIVRQVAGADNDNSPLPPTPSKSNTAGRKHPLKC